MNDKIKTLAEQAGFMLWDKESWNPGDVIDWSARYDKELEAFAELIIRECVDIADEYNGVGFTIVGRIKQHFGVE
jgi:glycogen synthase